MSELQASSDNAATSKTLRVWDLPTRLFHWSLVGIFAIVWISSEADGNLFYIHVYSGTAILGLVVFRLVWGVIGSRYALFSNFVTGWSSVKDYGQSLKNLTPPYHVGHNPVGGWMIILLLVLLGLTSFGGFYISDDGYVGPLAASVSPSLSKILGELHEGISGFLMFLVVVHIAGVVAHVLLTRDNLPRAMVTGDKTIPPGIDASGIGKIAFWRVMIAVLIAIGAVWSIYL